MGHFIEKTYYEFLHKRFEYTTSLFLHDILDETPLHPIGEYFDVLEIGDMIRIIPLFYCSRIISDGDGIIIDSPYMIMVPSEYNHIISFIGEDNQTNENISISEIIDNGKYVTVWTQTQETGELVPNIQYKVIFMDSNDVIISENYRMTGYHGYDGFIKPDEAESFSVELVE